MKFSCTHASLFIDGMSFELQDTANDLPISQSASPAVGPNCYPSLYSCCCSYLPVVVHTYTIPITSCSTRMVTLAGTFSIPVIFLFRGLTRPLGFWDGINHVGHTIKRPVFMAAEPRRHE